MTPPSRETLNMYDVAPGTAFQVNVSELADVLRTDVILVTAFVGKCVSVTCVVEFVGKMKTLLSNEFEPIFATILNWNVEAERLPIV